MKRELLLAAALLWVGSESVADPVSIDPAPHAHGDYKLSSEVDPYTITPARFPYGIAIVSPPPPPSGCPFATSTDGSGCANSPGGSVQNSTFFSGYAQQSGQSWVARPTSAQRNYCGIDYACGALTGSHTNAVTGIAGLATFGCSGLVVANGTRRVSCSNAGANKTITGWDFCNSGTSGAVSLELDGNYTLSNDIFCDDSNTDLATDSTLIRIDDPGAANKVVFTSVSLLINATIATQLQYAVKSNQTSVGSELDVFYTYCKGNGGKCFAVDTQNLTFVQKWNYNETFNGPFASHGEPEISQGSTTTAGVLWDNEFNTYLQTSGYVVSDASGVSCTVGNAGCGGVHTNSYVSIISGTPLWTAATFNGDLWIANKQASGSQGQDNLLEVDTVVGTLTITNNTGDPTGSTSGTTCVRVTNTVTTPVYSGNTNIVTGGAITPSSGGSC